ncbi:MAG: lytic transglycosylase domain-containing protein [Vampirovibrio sp.]
MEITTRHGAYEASQGYRLVKAKIGESLAKVAYDEVLKHQKEGATIDLTMWYTLVNFRENHSWNFKAYHKNDDGTWDVGLGQVNSGHSIDHRLFNPDYNIQRSIRTLAHKNLKAREFKEKYGYPQEVKWLTFKLYNGWGPDATAYATDCWTHYSELKGA